MNKQAQYYGGLIDASTLPRWILYPLLLLVCLVLLVVVVVMELKAETLYEKKCCEICKSDRYLHVHHILYKSSNPELALDKENLMVLCEECHDKMHLNDKHKFSKREGEHGERNI